MNWGRLGTWLSGALLAGAVLAAFAPVAVLILIGWYSVQGWLKTATWTSTGAADWYKIKLPHTSWAGLQRVFDLIDGLPGPVILLCTCVFMAVVLFSLSRLVAESANRSRSSY
ncbi:MAG TPA: hypothetical protein VHU23_16955 [Rhizomicrobium sp.]|jgi:hypothetical protein|nr:hypothetical protein [Rhizomicrobium sp.]